MVEDLSNASFALMSKARAQDPDQLGMRFIQVNHTDRERAERVEC
jgi:hypothetical protein